MITLKLNFTQLKHAVRKMKGESGEMDCLIIPIESNALYRGDKGIYLEMIAFEVKEKKDSKDTHLIKQSFSKEVRKGMTDEQLKSLPILGNMRIWDDLPETTVNIEPVNDPLEQDDLPF